MKTIEQTRRELFEASRGPKADLSKYQKGTKNGEYKNPVTSGNWKTWNAALDAVVIELPRACAYESLDSSRVFVQLTYELGSKTVDPVALARLEDCRTAIESTNLGLKIK